MTKFFIVAYMTGTNGKGNAVKVKGSKFIESEYNATTYTSETDATAAMQNLTKVRGIHLRVKQVA